MVLIFLGFTTSFISLFFLQTGNILVLEWELLTISSTSVSLPFILDPIGITFSTVVSLISGSVLWFSSHYMGADPFNERFKLMVLIFVASMNLLIFIPNLICLLLGWDGLGVISFALVIYYQNSKSLGAGMITALSNRIGDLMILVAIALTLTQGHWNILAMWTISPWISLCIIIAAMTKSAQMPFSAWLPAAMAAPTPVSALVHSSTLVTAGVFLLIRFFYFIVQTPYLLKFLLIIAVMTCLMAGLSANLENDLKKIIALSTLSQLGVMMSSIALHLPLLALYHLFTHAMFKALLFLCAGSMIYSKVDTQDIRSLSGTWYTLPVTTAHLNIANLSLCGAPFLSGFYSKDLILEAFLSYNNLITLIAMSIATGLTAAYSLRLSFIALWGKVKMPLMALEKTKLTNPMTLLSFFGVVQGYLLHKLFLGCDAFLFTEKMMIPLMILSGAYLGIILFKHPKNSSFLRTMWNMPEISSQKFISPLPTASPKTKSLDPGWLEVSSFSASFKKAMTIHYASRSPHLSTQTLVAIMSLTLYLLYMLFMHT
uniref:NADH-ubiquinone oxidoreductase chain 5 n=1 Tax=Patella vulgata TaxID=6465 RepID=A0A481MVK7_PATVU|nr:NADH dehydrogenase subunit 5 [Patella vulgata]